MSERPFYARTRLGYHEIQIIDRVLAQWCADRRLDPNGPEAQRAARELVDLFYIGVRSEEELKEAVASI